jgi:hypothetical protein
MWAEISDKFREGIPSPVVHSTDPDANVTHHPCSSRLLVYNVKGVLTSQAT